MLVYLRFKYNIQVYLRFGYDIQVYLRLNMDTNEEIKTGLTEHRYNIQVYIICFPVLLDTAIEKSLTN